MTQDDDDDFKQPLIPVGDLAPILTAAVFGLAFLAGLFWVLTTNDPWHDYIPKDKPAASSGEVVVDVPEKGKN